MSQPFRGPTQPVSEGLRGPLTVVEAAYPRGLGIRELTGYRHLLWMLAWRDIKVRYSQTIFGFGWILVIPLAQILVYSVLFGSWLKVPSNNVPYPVFVCVGLLSWQFFARGVAEGASSLYANQDLIGKVYIPRLLLPLAGILCALLDLVAGFFIVGVMMTAYAVAPAMTVVLAPLYLLLVVVTTLGFSLWAAALCTKYRDIRHMIPYLVQFIFFASPVIYPVSAVPARWSLVLALNPLSCGLDGLRWAVFGAGDAPSNLALAVSTAMAMALLVSGAFVFRRVEFSIVDYL